ncbi:MULTISPECIES: hypothetical protein [pseudomallei group]|uniref:Uncharacterized protein n=1 Tax=Burkholderia savannae TaxID=1637837 RepID=A0ABR5T453_9BURK|nr:MULTISPECIES: hypothetical protein [pseudomallei group]UYE89877.1 hypothetical protein PhiBtE2641_36 [Burkholderia phage PhiBt-E264.1]AHI76961.1 putative membrane protein [Burkholderia thailandensis 2002721723]AIP29143.1 putative membrane protein [Burkholderia thailandensis E264]AIS97504.1 putative membrane protein [Burkholderia thailandensis MSMB59]AJY02052.1 putative membrane protein [Burkholderia thailandensis 2002721643]
MKWITDRLLLIVTAAICLAASWIIVRLTGEWFPSILLVISFATLLIDNARLRKLLEQNGINPRQRKR